MNSRRGRIRITCEALCSDLNIPAMFEHIGFMPDNVEDDYPRNQKIYTGTSREFEKLVEGSIAPFYNLEDLTRDFDAN